MRLIVNPHKIEIFQEEAVNEKEINISKCEFDFSDEITDEFVKEAYFTLGNDTYKKVIVNNECTFPQEVLVREGTIELGVVAYLVENGEEIKRYNPTPVYFKTDLGSLKEAQNSEEITPSEMEQYQQALQDGLSEVNDKLIEIDDAILEANTLDADVNKEGSTATITITKKDGTTKSVNISDGAKGETGETGATGPEGPQGIPGRDGAIQYTAGKNISIENNVIATTALNQTEVQGLIDASIEELGELGFTPTVVQTLPIQDIDTHTIYLVPKQDSEQEDAYDEWLYINNAWEHIGSTAVDLSNYYTKSEVNIIANAKLPYYKLDLTTIISNGKVNLNTTDLEALSVIFTDAYSKEYTAINILMTATYNNGKVMQVLLMPSSQRGQDVISNNLTSYVFEYFCNQGYVGYPADQSYYNVIFGWLNVNNIVWNGNICTVGGCQFNGTLNTIPTSQGVLMKDNRFSYTPTSNYHPATKKYVDNKLTTYSGYDATKTQVLKNINGTLTWVDE